MRQFKIDREKLMKNVNDYPEMTYMDGVQRTLEAILPMYENDINVANKRLFVGMSGMLFGWVVLPAIREKIKRRNEKKSEEE